MSDPRADLYERYRDQGLSHAQALQRIQQADDYERFRDEGLDHQQATDRASREASARQIVATERQDIQAGMQAAARQGGPTRPTTSDPTRGESSLLGRATSIPRHVGRDVAGGLLSGAMRASDALNPLGDPLRDTRERLDARRDASRRAQQLADEDAPVAGIVGRLAEEGAKYGIVGTVAPSLVASPAIRGGSAVGRIATRAARDAAQQGLAETALGAAEGNSAEDIAQRQRVGAGYGAAFGGALQAGGDAIRGARRVRRPRPIESLEELPPREVIEQTARGPRPMTPPEGTPPLPESEVPDFIRRPNEGMAAAIADFGNERGFAARGVMQSIAGAGVGGTAGAAVDDENPMRGALLGAAAGGGLPVAGRALVRAARRELPALADDVKRIKPPEPGPASAVAPEHPVRVGDYARLSKFALDATGEARLAEEVERVVQRYGLAPKQRITWEETRTIASQLGLEPGDIITRQGRLSGPEMLAIRNVVADNTRELVRLEARRAAGNLSEEAVEHVNRQIAGIEGQNNALLSRFTKERSQTGRDLNNLKILASTSLDSATWFARAERLKGKPLLAAEQAEIARLLTAGDRTGAAKFVADLRAAPLSEKVINVWRAGLLTGLRTHEANMVGNFTMAALETAKDAPAVVWDRLIGLAFGGRKTKALTSDVFAASLRGARQGAREAKDILRRGVVDDAALRFDQVHGELDYGNPLLNVYVNGVYRTLSAEDRLFRGMALHRSLAEQAAVVAGKDKAVQRQLMQAPSDDMIVQAIADAEVATFSDQTKIAGLLSGAQRTFGKLLVPFARTPGNIATRTLEYGGGGILAGLYRSFQAGRKMTPAQQRQIADMMGRATTGAPLVAFGFWLASQGKATGAYPGGAAGQTQSVTGQQSNAVKIGNEWRAVNRLSPLGNLIALGANLYELGQNPSGWNAAAAAMATASSAVEAVSEQTSLQGVNTLLDAVNEKNPERRWDTVGRYATSLAGSAIPTLAADVARTVDPTVRDARSMSSAVQSRIPGASRQLPARVDQLGETMRREHLPGGALWDFTNPRTDKTSDPVRGEIARVGAEIGTLKRKDGETPQQYAARSRRTGAVVDSALRQLIRSGGYRSLPDEVKKEAIEYAVSRARSGDRLDVPRIVQRVRQRNRD